MAEFPGFTIWTDAYLADTGHLSMAEHGGYLKLLIAMWRSGGYLPNDDRKLARFASATEKDWLKVKPALMEFFTEVDGQITQGRLLDELEKARTRSFKASQNARSKYRKSLDTTPAPAHNPQSEKGSGSPASISTSITTDKKEPAVPKKGTRISDDFEPDQDYAVEAGLRPERVLIEVAKFKDYWRATAGQKGVKLDWPATWRNWVRSALDRQGGPRGSPSQGKSSFREHQDAVAADFERAANGRSSDNNGQPAFDLGQSDFKRN